MKVFRFTTGMPDTVDSYVLLSDLDQLIESYHDVANDLSDFLDGRSDELPEEIDKQVRKIRDSMDSLYVETIPDLQRIGKP